MRELTKHLRNQLNAQIVELENLLDRDVLSIFGPIILHLENGVKKAVEKIQNENISLFIHNREYF